MDPPTYDETSDRQRQRQRQRTDEPRSALGSNASDNDSSDLAGADAALINLVPLPGRVSFQHGYLGWTAASLRGLVQIKIVDNGTVRQSIDRVTLQFLGIERIKASNQATASSSTSSDLHKQQQQQQAATHPSGLPVELVNQTKTLWSRDDAVAASEAAAEQREPASSHVASSIDGPPSSLEFMFNLTDDLPHCCHIGSGSIDYQLIARLHMSRDLNSASEGGGVGGRQDQNHALLARRRSDPAYSIPIHISRTSPPVIVDESEGRVGGHSTGRTQGQHSPPELYMHHHPTEISVFFPHGTSDFKRSEPIQFKVRIPPPDAVLVQEKGLKLRSISAELIRTITIHDPADGSLPSVSDPDDRITPVASGSTVNERASGRPQPRDGSNGQAPSLKTIISWSGKSAAFSSMRSVFLNIWLQPVPAGSCEAITQSTIYQEISFSIRVTANLKGRQGDRDEVVVFDRVINILPDFPPASPEDLGEDVPPRAIQPKVAGSTYKPAPVPPPSATKIDPETLRMFETEQEYDGYEQLSEEASTDNPPPTIDADEPPPAIESVEQDDRQRQAGPSNGKVPLLPHRGHIAAAPSSGGPAGAGRTGGAEEEAPPYSSATSNAAALPESAVVGVRDTLPRSSGHPPNSLESAGGNLHPLPPATPADSDVNGGVPPPPYERERRDSIAEADLNSQDARTLRDMRRAMHEILGT